MTVSKSLKKAAKTYNINLTKKVKGKYVYKSESELLKEINNKSSFGAMWFGSNVPSTEDLVEAIYMKDLNKVKELINKGVDVNKAVENEGDLDAGRYWYPIHQAMYSNIDIVNELIKAGADVNKRLENGETPLHEIGWGRTYNALIHDALLRAGANPTIKNNKGQTPNDFFARNIII